MAGKQALHLDDEESTAQKLGKWATVLLLLAG
jgi:hypothetical protein